MSQNQHIFFYILKKNKLPTPIPEFKFIENRKFRADYAWPEYKILLEVEGGIWKKGGGAHSRPSNIMRDIEKYNLATLNGWRVYRTTPQKLTSAETIQAIKNLIIIHLLNNKHEQDKSTR